MLIAQAAASCLSGVLAFSAIMKLASFDDFVASTARSLALPVRVVRPGAFLTLAAESLCVVLLMLPATRRVGGIAATILFLSLTAALIRILRNGEGPCNCFGVASPTERAGGLDVVRNLAAIALAATVVAVSSGAGADSMSLSAIAVGLAATPLLVSLPAVLETLTKPFPTE